MYAEQLDDNTLPPMTEAEYLEFEANSDIKHEYKRGRIYTMSGGTVRNATITASIGRNLGNVLDERDCTFTSPDVRVHIAHKKTYRYPDVTVFCGDPAYLENRRDTIINPVLVVEVLSPESAVRDVNEKLEEYTQIATLNAYLIVSQDQSKVVLYRRNDADTWLYRSVRWGEDEDEDTP